jgi:hypothetical protein
MGFRRESDGFHPDQKDIGREAYAPPWLPTEVMPPVPIDMGHNGAGNGGNGDFSGDLIDSSYAAFEPLNVAEAGTHTTAVAHQTNLANLDQSATQIAGIGGDGGDGYFEGAMAHAPVAIFHPVNVALAGFHGAADAHQSNAVQFHQGAFQFAGGGGGGNGDSNAASGGAGTTAPGHAAVGSSLASNQGPIGFDALLSGNNHAGNGGDGYFYGSLVHSSVTLYDPINIAVAGDNSTSYADQSNNVQFDQTAFQMAGVGGPGGSGDAALGGDLLGLIGSDVIATGGNGAGTGGDGHFAGSLLDLKIAIYAPINIAVAGPNSTADAHQTNNVEFDQGAIQIAGIGGDGGHGNAALGGDAATHLLSDLHLLGHG